MLNWNVSVRILELSIAHALLILLLLVDDDANIVLGIQVSCIPCVLCVPMQEARHVTERNVHDPTSFLANFRSFLALSVFHLQENAFV